MIFLRALLFNAYFFALTVVMGLGGLGLRLAARPLIFGYARFWARLVLAGARHICGIHLQVEGQQTLPADGPVLLASQHQSAFDTLVWMTLVPRTSYIVKQELTRIPLFGPLLAPAGMIPVDRRAGAIALRGLLQAARVARQGARQMVIFPEGTRVAPGDRVSLQPGIAAISTHLDMPVTPVATNSGRYWGRRAFMKYPGTIRIAIGPAIPAGTPRAALLPAIEAFWRQAEKRWEKPVGNSGDK